MGGDGPRSLSRSRSAPVADAAASTNVRVVCRLRPMSEQEKKMGTTPAVSASSGRSEVAVLKKVGARQARSSFHFDEVLSSCSTQADTFAATLAPLVDQVLSGYEATAFAYGQTGTGKTHTMEGNADCEEGRGLMPRAAAAVLDALSSKEYTESSVTVSYLEIYNEELSDLLAPANYQPKLDLMETGDSRGVCCVGLSEVQVKSVKDIQNLVCTAQEKRRIAETRMNARSSRSHCIFTMKVTCRKIVDGGELESLGKLHLVDLAGSECAKKAAWSAEEMSKVGGGQAQAGAAEQERERKNINQSLLTLGRVIAALRDKSGRVPYRDSKLTRMLKDALGGSCKTVIIATISPALSAVDETISTLSYAEQASCIKNKPTCSSLLRSARSGAASPVDCGSEEYEELQMKIGYLTQELEEAQAALARKYQEMLPIIERAEVAEAKLEEAAEEVKAARSALEESNSLRLQLLASTKEVASDLTTAAGTVTHERDAIVRELQEFKQQRAEEERLVALLKEQREVLQADVSTVGTALQRAKAELSATQSEIASLKNDQSKARGKALQAIIQFATREIGNLGVDLDKRVDSYVDRLDHGGVLVGEASESMALASSHSLNMSAQAQDAASAWSQQLAVNYSNFERHTYDLSQTALETVTAAASSLKKLEVLQEMPVTHEQRQDNSCMEDQASMSNVIPEGTSTIFEDSKENAISSKAHGTKTGEQKGESLLQEKPRIALKPIN